MDLLHIRHRELFSEVADLKDKKLFFCTESKRLKGALAVTVRHFLSLPPTTLPYLGLHKT